MRTYGEKVREYRLKYNKRHDYSNGQKLNRKYTWAEMYLIWNKRMEGGRMLTDIEIAKLLKRSLQSIQLKRYKMRKGEW